MKSRLLATWLVLESAAALAQSVSGRFTGTWTGTDALGVPTTHLELALSCEVGCETPVHSHCFSVTGDVSVAYAADLASPAGWVSWGFVSGVKDTGFSSADSTTLPAGANVVLTARRIACGCSDGLLRSSLLDVTSNVVHIPPFVRPPLSLPVQAGGASQASVAVAAAPRGDEVVTVTLSGAGLARVERFTAGQWQGSSTSRGAVVRYFELGATTPGLVTATAELTGAPPTSVTFEVVKVGEPTGGCSAAGGALAWSLGAAALLLRRAGSRQPDQPARRPVAGPA